MQAFWEQSSASQGCIRPWALVSNTKDGTANNVCYRK